MGRRWMKSSERIVRIGQTVFLKFIFCVKIIVSYIIHIPFSFIRIGQFRLMHRLNNMFNIRCSSGDIARQYRDDAFFKTFKSRPNDRYFTGDILKNNFLFANSCILTQISLIFVPKCPIKSEPPLVHIMARCLAKQAIIWISDELDYWRTYTKLIIVTGTSYATIISIVSFD